MRPRASLHQSSWNMCEFSSSYSPVMHKNVLLDKNRPGRQSNGVGRSEPAWLPFSSSNDWIQQSLVAWDSTHMPPIQEIILPLRHWANRSYELKSRGPLQPDLYVELRKMAPPSRPVYVFRARFRHIILSETMQQIIHYPALSCLIMSPPHPAQITLSFLFNISQLPSEAAVPACICWKLIPACDTALIAILSPSAAPQTHLVSGSTAERSLPITRCKYIERCCLQAAHSLTHPQTRRKASEAHFTQRNTWSS